MPEDNRPRWFGRDSHRGAHAHRKPLKHIYSHTDDEGSWIAVCGYKLLYIFHADKPHNRKVKLPKVAERCMKCVDRDPRMKSPKKLPQPAIELTKGDAPHGWFEAPAELSGAAGSQRFMWHIQAHSIIAGWDNTYDPPRPVFNRRDEGLCGLELPEGLVGNRHHTHIKNTSKARCPACLDAALKRR